MKALMKKETGLGMAGLTLCDIEKPVPGRGEMLVKVMAVGICGTDIHIMEDQYLHSVPVVLGHEFTGVIDTIGDEVSGFNLDDQVIVNNIIGCGHCSYCRKGNYVHCKEKQSIGINLNGGMAEYVLVPADHAIKVPESMKGRDIFALSEPLACCVRAVLEQSQIRPGDWALVTGPGVIGLLCAQLAKLCGARVIISGTAADGERLKLAEKIGIDVTVDNNDDLTKAVREQTDGGVDIVFECSGNARALAGAVECLKKQGALTQVGMFGREIAIDIDGLIRKEIKLTSSFATAASTWDLILKLYEQDILYLEELVSERLPLSQWKDGFEMFLNRVGNKIFLIP